MLWNTLTKTAAYIDRSVFVSANHSEANSDKARAHSLWLKANVTKTQVTTNKISFRACVSFIASFNYRTKNKLKIIFGGKTQMLTVVHCFYPI